MPYYRFVSSAASSSPDAFWAAESTKSGVLVANRLATSAALTDWIVGDSTADHVSVSTSVKPLGGTGSFRFEVRNTDSTASGSVSIPFPSQTDGDIFWVSMRIMADDAAAYQQWCFNGVTAAKLFIISRDANGASPTSSNQVNEIVASMGYSGNNFSYYYQDGSGSPGPDEPFGGSDFKWQPVIDRGTAPLSGNDPATGTNWSTGTGSKQERARYGGLYSTQSNAEYQPGIGDPISGAVKQKGGVWFTVTMRIKLTTMDGSATTHRVSMWIAEDGEPYELIIDKQNVKLGNGPDYNGVSPLPYVSQRSPGGRKSTVSGISGITILGTGGGTHTGAGSLEYVASTGAFRFAASNDSYGTARYISAANGVYLMNLKSSLHGTSTTTNGSVTLPQSSIVLTNASAFPSGGGSFVLGEPDTSTAGTGPSHGNGEQYITYTGKSGNTLTGCTGGTGTHDSGSPVKIASYIGVRVDNPALLPSSGTTTATVTTSDGRNDGNVYMADAIISNGPIYTYPGYAPLGVSDLSDLAIAASSNSWTAFTMPDLDNAILFANTAGSGNLGIVNGFGYNMYWDALHSIMVFGATSHTGGVDVAGGGGFVWWSDPDNDWTRESYTGNSDNAGAGLPTVPLVGHGYYHMTVNTFNGDVYFRLYGSTQIRRRVYGSTGASSWTNFSTIGGSWGNQAAGALVFYPELNSGAGGLVFVDVAGAKVSNSALTSWSDATGAPPTGIGNLQNWGIYANGLVYFGGGNSSTKMWSLSAAGVVTARADTPVECGSANTAMVVAHPNGVDLLAFERANGGNIYKYTASSNTWSTVGTHSIAASSVFTACCIPDYGVIVFIKFAGSAGTPTCVVYKP